MRLIIQLFIVLTWTSRVHFRLNSCCTVKITPQDTRGEPWFWKSIVDAEIATLADDSGRTRLTANFN